LRKKSENNVMSASRADKVIIKGSFGGNRGVEKMNLTALREKLM